MPRNFSALNQYARRVYEFRQGDSMGRVNQDEMHQHYDPRMTAIGVCTGVALHWIKEKLTTTQGVRRLYQSPRREFRTNAWLPFFHPKMPGNPGRHQRTTVAAAYTHSAYLNGTIDVAANEIGLTFTFDRVNPAKRPPGHESTAKPFDDLDIAKAASDLKCGSAVLIEVIGTQQDNGSRNGHSIAFYRSRGNALHFFDPNAGVYELYSNGQKTVLDFVKAWMQAYRDSDNIIWSLPAENWGRIYRRA
jgi:hypothetical protein